MSGESAVELLWEEEKVSNLVTGKIGYGQQDLNTTSRTISFPSPRFSRLHLHSPKHSIHHMLNVCAPIVGEQGSVEFAALPRDEACCKDTRRTLTVLGLHKDSEHGVID